MFLYKYKFLKFLNDSSTAHFSEILDLYLTHFMGVITSTLEQQNKKFRIRETKNLSTKADSRTDTILERLRDLSKKK